MTCLEHCVGEAEPKGKEVPGSWRRLHNEELHNLYATPNIIRVIKCSSMGRAEHIKYMER
jgi:hypothetical protein